MISTKKCDAYRSLVQDISINLTLAHSFYIRGIKLIGSGGILAVFVAGTFFSATSTEEERRGEERVVEGADCFFTIPIFALLGLALPWHEWEKLGLEGLMLAC